MSKFSKQHYELVAKILRTQFDNRTPFYSKSEQAEEDHWADLYADAAARNTIKKIAVDFHNVFRLDNDRYDQERFWLACGRDDWADIIDLTDDDLAPYRRASYWHISQRRITFGRLAHFWWAFSLVASLARSYSYDRAVGNPDRVRASVCVHSLASLVVQ